MYSHSLSLSSALVGGGWSTPGAVRFTPRRVQVLIVQKVGWSAGLVWTVEENLSPNGIRSLGLSTCSE
jgi:hypothetical protein